MGEGELAANTHLLSDFKIGKMEGLWELLTSNIETRVNLTLIISLILFAILIINIVGTENSGHLNRAMASK